MDKVWRVRKELEILIPSHLFDYAEQQRIGYSTYLESHSVGEEQPNLLPVELCTRLICCIAGQIQTEHQVELLTLTWDHLQSTILGELDIHALAVAQSTDRSVQQRIIRGYFDAFLVTGIIGRLKPSGLHIHHGEKAMLHGVFGGQGNTTRYFDEIRSVSLTYGALVDDLLETLGHHLLSLSRDTRVSEQYANGIDVLQWLRKPASTPTENDLLAAPVSFPLIGLLQLLYFKAILLSLGLTPAEIPNVFNGLSGHSQGVVVACALSTASDWPTFHDAALKAVTILFWIGARCQQHFSKENISPQVAQEFLSAGYGPTSPMLAVSGLCRRELELAITRTNETSPPERYVTLSLTNTDSQFIVSGFPRTLGALIRILESIAPKSVSSRARIPHSQRKPSASMRFLPVTIPSHCKLLDAAIPVIEEDLQGCFLSTSSLRLPVNALLDGSSLTSLGPHQRDLVPRLIRMVVSEPVDWPLCAFTGVRKIVDFGPGASTGVGLLTRRNLRGNDARVIVAGTLGSNKESELGSLVELFSNEGVPLPRFTEPYRVSVVKTAAGPMIGSKFSRLFGLPPFLIAGMTPTTTHPEFVAAAMRAGYPVEFAAGGYNNADSLRSALCKLRDMMPAGRTITINIIYVSPKALAWQIPLIRQLRAEGFPLTGMTVGGGVPSLEVATDYITTLGLDHVSFKPGSVAGIRQVIEIARRIRPFPVVLQWTGGRGGGHHSAEDFHAPLLETYAAIRTCENIVLVAGSGFGSCNDVTPYLTGTWSMDHGQRSAMPVDGVLFGSRVMACAEAYTSQGAKQAIVAAPGVDDSAWEGTYQKAVGGVISIVSEMGEPMHVIATRGAQLWADLDKSIFSLEKNKRVAALMKRKTELIARLNADHQKPWFGEKSGGRACDVTAMTYGEVARRLARLMFMKHMDCWVDESYSSLFADWLRRIEARFANSMRQDENSFVDDSAISRQGPDLVLETILRTFPDATTWPLYSEDHDYFLQLCSRPGQKPVPFIPVLDENFERWFKKDSLWQSEQLEAVLEQDVGRLIILHGPVAARHTRKVNEPVGEVLDGINHGVIRHFVAAEYDGDESRIPFEEFLKPNDFNDSAQRIPNTPQSISSHSPQDDLWVNALLRWRSVLRGRHLVDNPIRKLLEFAEADMIESNKSSISLYEGGRNEPRRLLMHASKRGKDITCLLYTHTTASGQSVPLTLKFEYHPETSYAPIWESWSGREESIRNLYCRLWRHVCPSTDSLVFEDRFRVERSRVNEFNRAINASLDKVLLDFAIVPAWGAICGALLHHPTQGDLLNLLFLSNMYEVHTTASPMKIGDELVARARVTSVAIDNAGKTVEIACKLRRTPSGPILVTILSRFRYRGTYTDFDSTFTQRVEPHYELKLSCTADVAVLDSKPWFRVDDPRTLDNLNLPDVTLEFHLQTHTRCSSVNTSGKAYARSEDGELTPIATIELCQNDSNQSPVLSYLLRRGRIVDSNKVHRLSPVSPAQVSYIRAPTSNEPYSAASDDFNPIHTSPSFARLAGLPGTITHGMYCSAAVALVLENYLGGKRRVMKYQASFAGMVLPDQLLKVSIRHTGMQAGLAIYDIEVQEAESGTRVLTGSALATQPATTIVFTGQGSQEKGMGMDLYASSSVARGIWDIADAYFLEHLGVSILNIVRDNPKEIKVHFGGARGRELRRKYMSMQDQVQNAEGKLEPRPLFPTIKEDTIEFTHTSPKGLLFATQFAQPALAIMEMAAFRDMQASGVVDTDFRFTGHSLGEWVALACGTDFLSLEEVLKFFFYRGMTMQGAVERDAFGQSAFSMVAVDPSRMGKDIDESAIEELVRQIRVQTGWFIEIVNRNIRNSQYVCAGDSRALDLVQKVADDIKALGRPGEGNIRFESLISQNARTYGGLTSTSISLQRGAATIPLAGMDVPFHSSKLRPKMQAWKHMLEGMVGAECFHPSQLVGRYVPNVTGKPFSISQDYFEHVWATTRSQRLREVLDNWESWVEQVQRDRRTYFPGSSQVRALTSQNSRQICC
ncbi:fatty acid synthase subunit beta [Fonsecaea erecta]|uniref:Fatty acid synthase subunit beta n=1 Tax=Fonsecaea erecta TaxID=1367422 RepID=A0A178ZRX0_9EURO|nr:fatty acid synthase subunit beta [Fonsecaea erecta]OAP62564.1 fatty acid synthase subunit beta [Fonsecaea erecta]